MADIRFKIDGNNPPFRVDVERNGNLVRSEVFEFSGTSNGNIKDEGYACAIVSDLSLSTTYDVIVTDKIGNTSTPVQITTPSLSISIPVEKTISLGGQIIDVGTNRQISSPQPSYLIIDPPLEDNEAFNICLCSTYVGSVEDNPTSFVDVCKYCANTGQNVLLYRVNDNNDQESINTRICVGDNISYILNASISAEPTQSESSKVCLSIEETTLCTDIDNISMVSPSKLVASVSCNVTTTTTTTTTTAPPTTENVYIGITRNDSVDKSINNTNTEQEYTVPSPDVIRVWFSTADIYDPDGNGYGQSLDTDLSFTVSLTEVTGDGWSTMVTNVKNLQGLGTDGFPPPQGPRIISGTIPSGQKQASFDMIVDNTQKQYAYNINFSVENTSNRFNDLPIKTGNYGWVSSDSNVAEALIGFYTPQP